MTELLQIFVFRDGAYVGNEVYTDSEILIGTADGVDLHLDDDLVSPRHAVIKQENGQVRLTRLGALPLRVNRKDVQSVVIGSRDEDLSLFRIAEGVLVTRRSIGEVRAWILAPDLRTYVATFEHSQLSGVTSGPLRVSAVSTLLRGRLNHFAGGSPSP